MSPDEVMLKNAHSGKDITPVWDAMTNGSSPRSMKANRCMMMASSRPMVTPIAKPPSAISSERIVAEKGVTDATTLDRYYHAWDHAADRTPHGTPIELRPEDFR